MSMHESFKKLLPLALCLAVGLSCNLASGGGSDERGSRSGDAPGGRAEAADELAGTTWKGSFSCDDGEEIQANYRFAESGNPIYEYQTKSGPREVELAEAGQTIRFVPPGGGVTTIVIDDISVAPERISHTMTISREQTSGGTLDQSSSTIQSEALLSGSELEVEFTVRSQGVLSQPGIVVPGNASTVTCRGKLRR
jgi:hypothetical protein